jgi:alkylresorcinol/alkylpyrone synthase
MTQISGLLEYVCPLGTIPLTLLDKPDKDTPMTTPTIISLATGLPPYQYRQMDLHDHCLPYINSPRAKAIYAAAEIETRYSVLADANFFATAPGTEVRNDLYLEMARSLGVDTISRVLAQADLKATDIDHLIVTSCTGLTTPGLDVSLAGALGMKSDLRRSGLIGMGCYAGLTALDRAMLELAARPSSHVLVLALEFCTLQFQASRKLDDMVAGALFGDGLAAVVIGPETTSASPQPRLLETMTYSNYQMQELMGVHLSDTGFQIRLATRVPKLLQQIVPDVVANFLHHVGLTQTDVRFWGIHPGGAKILDYLEEALALTAADLCYSRQVLRNYGNMSSATIFFVLETLVQQGQPQPGDYALLLAFGPGLTIELCLLGW